MKISTNALFDRATQQMGTVQTTLAKSQAQLAAGKQVITPSDAPTQAASIQRLKSIMARQDSYADTLRNDGAVISDGEEHDGCSHVRALRVVLPGCQGGLGDGHGGGVHHEANGGLCDWPSRRVGRRHRLAG